MSLFDALENFASNLPSALDELKELRRDFRKTFGDLALEGAELFTLGFEEMVLKDNANWKTSLENHSEARRMALNGRDQFPELAQRYEKARARLEDQWESLEKRRLECWDALQELDSLLPLEDRTNAERKASWPGFSGYINPMTGCVMGSTGDEPETPRWELPSTLPSAGPAAEEILISIEEEAYRRTLTTRNIAPELVNSDRYQEIPLLLRVNRDHRDSLEAVSAAKAHAADGVAAKALASWECEQLEPLADLLGRAVKVFRAGGLYCMAKATEVERVLEENSTQARSGANLRTQFQSTLVTARALIDLLAIPMVDEVEGRPAVNPAFLAESKRVETLLNA